jgi:hypothetical protein
MRRPTVVWLGLGVLLTAHAVVLVRASGGAFSSPDAPGYLLQARHLATEGTTALHPDSPAQFVDMQFLKTGRGEFRSRYPPGLPVLQALPYRLGGVPGALAVNPVPVPYFPYTSTFVGERTQLNLVRLRIPNCF